MPVSPSQRAAIDCNGMQGDDRDTELHGRKKRKYRQQLRERYAKARENAQVAGVIPTTPEGALREERVDPRLQGCQQLPDVILEALRENWNTPDAAKPAIIGALLEPFFSNDIVLDRDGNQIRVPPNRAMLIELAKTLRTLDQVQWERDNPEAAGKAKGGNSVSVQTNILAAKMVRDLIEQKQIPSPSKLLDGTIPPAMPMTSVVATQSHAVPIGGTLRANGTDGTATRSADPSPPAQ